MRISVTRWTWPDVSPLRHSVCRERLKYQASPVSMVRASASASNFGASVRPSSTSAVEPGSAKDSLDKEASRPDGPVCAAEALALAPAHQRDEADLLGGIVAERAEELRRDGERPWLLHAAHRHAGVLRLHQHRDPAGFENLVD